MSLKSVQQKIREAVKDQGRYKTMPESELNSETLALAKMTMREKEALMQTQMPEAQAESEAIQVILKHQAFSF